MHVLCRNLNEAEEIRRGREDAKEWIELQSHAGKIMES